MTMPALLFGVVVSTLMGALFHLWKNGGFGRLLLYLGLAWIGFWAGHWLGSSQEWDLFKVGPLRLGTAVLFGAVTLYGGHWLSLIKQEQAKH